MVDPLGGKWRPQYLKFFKNYTSSYKDFVVEVTLKLILCQNGNFSEATTKMRLPFYGFVDRVKIIN